MPVTENMRIFIERAREQRAREFWNSSKKYQNFCDSPENFPSDKNDALSFMEEHFYPLLKTDFITAERGGDSCAYITIHHRHTRSRAAPCVVLELGPRNVSRSKSWKVGCISFWNIPGKFLEEYNSSLTTRPGKRKIVYYDYSGKNIADTLVMIRKMLE